MPSRTVIAWFSGLLLLSTAAATVSARGLGGTEHKSLFQHFHAYLHRAGGTLDFGSYEWTLINEEAVCSCNDKRHTTFPSPGNRPGRLA